MEHKHWKISDFAKKLDKHNNTIDGWFRTMEEERKIHYISRINNEKVYDELDLEIANFIINKRNDKWSLDGIFDYLPKEFRLRPFPSDYKNEKPVQVVDFDKIRATIIAELQSTFEEVAAGQLEKQMQSFQRLLPSPEQQKLDRFNMIMTERKITRKLEDQALSMWSTKPEEERLVKVGWFRKKEDKEKRDFFVKSYIDEHFESELKNEFGIDYEDL